MPLSSRQKRLQEIADATGQPFQGAKAGDQVSQASQVVGLSEGAPVTEIVNFIQCYVAISPVLALVVAVWIVASWMIDAFDRFAHLVLSSAEKRCGKTTLLELIFNLVSNPRFTSNISSAALYRLIESEHPTLLMDESQSLVRRGSEQSEVIREILNAGIGRNAKVIRCGGSNMDEIREFSVYGPKVFALIGLLDAVLADRSFRIELRRKTPDQETQRFRWRTIERQSIVLQEQISAWTEANKEKVAEIYDSIEPFDIANDRMADLLTPLQATLTVGAPCYLDTLKSFADLIDERDREQELQSDGVRLLIAIRDIFEDRKIEHQHFIPTENLLIALDNRTDEPWGTYNRGSRITAEKLSSLLRPYGIRPDKQQAKRLGKNTTIRGYCQKDFHDAWSRYTPSQKSD